MKRTLAILLVLAMIVCMVPAFSVSAAAGDTCTVTEYRTILVTLFDNIVDGDGVGWYYYTAADATNLDTNWQTSIPTGWTALKANETFSRDSNLPAGFTNVWNAANYRDLWAVRKVTVSATDYETIKDKPLTSYMKHCDNAEVYVNGKLVLKDPYGQGWVDDLTTFNLTSNGEIGGTVLTSADVFLRDNTTGDYYAYVAAHVYRNNDAFWFDMNLEAVIEKYDGDPHTEVTIANADQWNDYARLVNSGDTRVNGNVPVQVTVTGDLDFTDKNIETIGLLTNTTIDFGSEKGYKVFGIDYVNGDMKNKDELTNNFVGNQAAVFATEAQNSTIKNLYLKDSTIWADDDETDGWFGILVGWAILDVTIENVTIDNVTLTHDGYDPNLDRFCGVAVLVGVSNKALTVKDITIRDTTINAPTTNVSIVTSRCDGDNDETTARNFSNITVESLTVNALAFGNSAAQQLSYTYPGNISSYTGYVYLNNKAEAGYGWAASQNGYSAYFQTRPSTVANAGEGAKDFRIIVFATAGYVNLFETNNPAKFESAIKFDLTFRSTTAENPNVSTTLTADKVYNSVRAINEDGVEVTYSAAENTYIFGWVVHGVPADYANETGNAVPVLNMKIDSQKYQEFTFTCTANSYYNSDNGVELAGGNTGFYATQRFTKGDLPNGTIIAIDSDWQYRAERWTDENIRPGNFTNRPDPTATNIVVIDANWWGTNGTKCGFNISKIDGTAITDADWAQTRLHIYVPVN